MFCVSCYSRWGVSPDTLTYIWLGNAFCLAATHVVQVRGRKQARSYMRFAQSVPLPAWTFPHDCFFFNLFIFNWRIIVLQYCVGFCHPSTFPPDFMFVHKAVWYNDIYQRSAVFLYDSRKLISSVQSLSYIWLFATPWTAAHQASLSITDSQSLLKLMSIESVIPSNHLLLFCPLLLPSVFPCIRVFSSELALHISYWSFSFNISPSHEYSGLISFRMDWLDLKKLITGPQSPHRVCQASPLCPPRLMLQPRNCFCILMLLLLRIRFSLPGTPLPASPHVQPPGS